MAPRRRIWAMLGSIRTRLAIFFFLITLIAVSVVYVYVTPSLQSRLEQQQLNDLKKLTRSVNSTRLTAQLTKLASEESTHQPKRQKLKPDASAIERKRAQQAYSGEVQTLSAYQAEVRNTFATLATRTGAKTVALLQVQRAANGSYQAQAPVPFYPTPPRNEQLLAQVSITAASTGKIYPKAYSSSLGFVAVPVPKQAYVFVYSVSFSDVKADVVLIRKRILVAAAIALAVVLLLGVLVARAITVRVLRLEQAAQRVARGDLTAHFEVDAHDELGQLAAALAHMQSQLLELENARRRFIATASHELRTPIFSLGGFLELIQDEELDEETRRQFVGQVREQVARLGKLATGLLDLSRLEAGSVDLEPTPTDIGVLSRAVAAEFVPALSLHQSALDLKLPETPLRAVVDPDRVAQLLRILIDNAITHTPDGTTVTVGVGNGNGMVRLSVADNGPGIPKDAVGRIFEPFYSADGVQGAGLGLAIARELAERLHGVLEVDSAGGATVFTLTLPGEEA
ncbi:MAG TPA: HAMP domain-containing sensor histidine kinase [Solirubrobacteraceae bacterium]|nr:HAMP domain-containing sensor histidine kinase [Solirubrobacteraceae bacterium]